jgi:hypothetical protein
MNNMRSGVEVREHRYGLATRPAGIGAVPKGFVRIDEPLPGKVGGRLSSYGVIVYDRPLSEDELYSFELVQLLSPDDQELAAVEIALSMSEYADRYLKLKSEDPEHFLSTVADRLKNLRRHRVYAGEGDRMAALIQARLENAVANKAATATPAMEAPCPAATTPVPEGLPEMCAVFIESAEPGRYVGMIRRGEQGYNATTYDEPDREKAKALVALLNTRMGVTALQAECMEAGSLFGWSIPGADPAFMQAKLNEKDESPSP